MPSSSTHPQGTHYIPTLDGWRAIAILAVLLFHSSPSAFNGIFTAPVRLIDGVHLFFALSGFLICSRLLREEAIHGTLSLKSFYIRRLFRIQPAALTYLAVLSLLGLFSILQLRWSGVATAALMVRNLYPAITPNHPEWYTAHFWSLAVEEHFYLLLPAFLLLVRRSRLLILSATVFTLEAWHLVVHHIPVLQGGAMYLEFRTDMALDLILMGCILAVAMEYPALRNLASRWLQPSVAILLAVAVSAVVACHHSNLDHTLLLSLYPLLILATVLHPNSPLSRLLELAPIRLLGRISFSLYLWQQLFLYSYVAPATGTLRSHTLLCWLAAFACALASYYAIERPFIRLGHRLTSNPARA